MDSDDDSHVDDKDIKIEDIDDVKPSKTGCVFPTESKFSHIKNKQVRTQQFIKQKKALQKVSWKV